MSRFCLWLIVGYADDKIVLDWMNSTEPEDSMQDSNLSTYPDSGPVMIDNNVELPQFEVMGVHHARCNKRYHQKSGKTVSCKTFYQTYYITIHLARLPYKCT